MNFLEEEIKISTRVVVQGSDLELKGQAQKLSSQELPHFGAALLQESKAQSLLGEDTNPASTGHRFRDKKTLPTILSSNMGGTGDALGGNVGFLHTNHLRSSGGSFSVLVPATNVLGPNFEGFSGKGTGAGPRSGIASFTQSLGP